MPKPRSKELQREAMRASRKLRLGKSQTDPRVFIMDRPGDYPSQKAEPEEVQPHENTMSGVLEKLKRLGQQTQWSVKPIRKGGMVKGKIAF